MTVILMGPSGSGKTTMGLALAAATGWRFVDADDLHPDTNIDRIRAGIPLTDADRAPWLARLRSTIEASARQGRDILVACSALREHYRHALADGLPGVHWVFLATSHDGLRRRLETRVGHFAGPAILEDQLRTLEPPTGALIVQTERPVPLVVQEICRALALPCAADGGTPRVSS